MAIDETRHELFTLLDERLGTRAAALLMAELPPAGWREFATKRDVDVLGKELRSEIAELRGEIKQQLAAFAHTAIYTNVGCMLGSGAIVLAAVKLA